MRPSAYFGWFAATLAALALAAFSFAVWADPYRFFDSAALPGWTVLKPRIYQQTEIAKTYQLERVVPKTLLLGNSRVEIGFDPESPKWPAESRPVFNAAEAGKSMFTALLMLREAIAVSPPKTVILGLDFQDFVEAPSPPDTPLPPVTAAERRLLADRDGHPNTLRWQQVWRDTFDTTLTIDAVYDSLATTFDQDPKTSTTMTKFGFNPRNEYRVFVKRSGYHDLFAQRNAANEHLYGAAGKPDFSDPSQSASFRYLQSIVDVATEHNIPLIVFIHPYHSDYLEMLHRLGLWQAFEDWKRTLVKVTATQTRAGTVRLFDFADYDDISTERVPPPGDTKSEMHWYWEAGHYKSTLGDELLTAMFAEKPQVGFLLGTDDIDSVLAKIRDDRLQFIATQQGRATQEGRDDNSHAGTLGSAVKPALLAPAQSR